MRYIKFCASTGYMQTEDTQVVAYEDNVKDEELDCDLMCFVEEVGDGYEYLAEREVYEEDYDTTEDYEEALNEAIEDFHECCTGYWEEISKEEYEELA